MFSNSRNDELEPRLMPKPTKFQELSAKPEVPELSVVFDSSENNSKPLNRNLPYYANNQTPHETYSEWKNRQNRSPPVHKETRNYDLRDKQYYGSSSYSDCDQNPYNHFSDKISYKSGSDCHKCTCQNTPTIKDIHTMMQLQNDQIKFLLETIQKLLVTVLSNQQIQHKCCCSENGHCKKDYDSKTTEELKKDETHKEYPPLHSNDNHTEPQINLKGTECVQKKTESNKNLKYSGKQDVTSGPKEKPKTPINTKCDKSHIDKDNNKEKEKTYSVISDESFDLNANDVQVIEDPISPEQSIHIEMKSSSDDSENSECEENDKKIEVGWTMYNNIIGQVNNLLEDSRGERKSEVAEPIECVKPTASTTPKNFEPYKHFILPENSKIDSSLQMQALAMQYLSPEQAGKFDMNKHFVPTTQPTMKSPNNYSISTLHYMERYHLIAPEKNYTSENPQQKLPTEGLFNKKKKSLRKNKTPSKILNITELKQQPKLS